MERPLRVIGILVCAVVMGLPQVVCYAGASPRVASLAHDLILAFPVALWALSRFWISEGRAQVYEEQASARERE